MRDAGRRRKQGDISNANTFTNNETSDRYKQAGLTLHKTNY